MKTAQGHIARWWEKSGEDRLRCTLCPRYCTLSEGQRGFCYIRQNVSGNLIAHGYGSPTGFAIDPVEKKPLNHFLPGTDILSFGSAGCNLGCKFCQNWTTSKAKLDDVHSVDASPEDVISLALQHHVPSIAFTYNDPVIIGEYVIDISQLAKQEHIETVMVTAGYIDPVARKDVFHDISAANVDLKAFTEEFYFSMTGSHLKDIQETLKWIKHETDVWLEITTLLIPGKNDSPDEITRLAAWVASELGTEVPVHFTAFHPDYKLRYLPQTPVATLRVAREIAMAEGLQYVYTGNVHDAEGHTTRCPKCGAVLVQRDWHQVSLFRIRNSKCPECSFRIAGKFRD